NKLIFVVLLFNSTSTRTRTRICILAALKGKLRNLSTIQALARCNYSQYEMGPSIKNLDTRNNK
ncbi:hypothetical protein GE21DRAFT_1183398, partial [Neurospora crassa]